MSATGNEKITDGEDEDPELFLFQQDVARLVYYASYILNLRESLVCSICLDLFENPVKVPCSHLYCGQCITTYLKYHTNTAPCPICQTDIPTTIVVEVCEYYSKLANFVRDESRQLREQLEIDTEELPTFQDILNKVKQNTDEPQQALRTKHFKLDSNPSAIKVGEGNKLFVASDEASAKDVNSLDGESSQSQYVAIDPFDLLKRTPSLNINTSKAYKAKKPSTSKESGAVDQINSEKTKSWLNDEHNNFNIIPKVHYSGKLKEIIPNFDMPSASQQHKVEKKRKRLTRSIDSSTKNIEVKKKLRHSTATCSSPKSVFVIEQFSEEDNINKVNLQALEKDYLDSLNKELVTEMKQPKGDKKSNSNNSMSSGWSRINKIKKIMNNTVKKPVKLKVVKSKQTTSKRITRSKISRDDTDYKIKHLQPVVTLERISVLSQDVRVEQLEPVTSNKCYNLDDIEPYLQKNVTNLCFKPTEKCKKTPGLRVKSSKKPLNASVSVEQIPAAQKSDEKLNICDDDEIFIKPTQEMPSKDLNKFRDEGRNEDMEVVESTQNINSCVAQSIEKNPNLLTDDDIFLNPTQEVNYFQSPLNDSTKQTDERKSNETELPLSPASKTLIPQLYKRILSLKTITKEFNEVGKANEITSLVQNLGEAIEEILKIFSSNAARDSESPTIPTTKDSFVQTNPSTVCFHNITTQTLVQHENVNDVGIQTDSLDSSKYFKISTIDAFNIPVVATIETQTEAIACTCAVKGPAKSSKTNSETLFMSESFDNIKFDTQDILKLKSIPKVNLEQVESQSNKTKEKPVDTFKPPSMLRSSASQDVILQTLPTKRNKRQRRLFDSDELLPKNVKRNKYMQENVSLHFESDDQFSRIGDDDNGFLSTGSSDAEYEKCLERVLRKCDEDVRINTQQSLPKEASKERTETQAMIEECEKLIKDACSTGLDIANTDTNNETLKTNNKNEFSDPSKLTMTILGEEFEHDFDSDNKDVFPKSSNMQILETQVKNTTNINEQNNKFSESIFTNGDILTVDNNNSHSHSKSNIDDLIINFNNENDSFAANMDLDENNSNKIVVLQNIIIAKKDDEKNEEQLKLNKSEDVFLSDSDIIETTPQKQRPVGCDNLALLSQYFNPSIILPPLPDDSPDIVSSCLNQTFSPPEEFQDSLVDQTVINLADDESNITLKPSSEIDVDTNKKAGLSSLTPELFFPPNRNPDCNLAGGLITSTPFESSQIITTRSLNLSPIKFEKPTDHQNPILAAQNSKYSPLNITKCRSPLPQKANSFGTSTPKQKSILNYARPTDSNTLTQTSKSSQASKPIVACTRITNRQTLAIMSLVNKKLLRFSKAFDNSVTHMIVSVNENKCISDHTMKYISAVAAGIWVLSFEWVEECIKRNYIVPEEPFETLDMSGTDGPRQSRLYRKINPLLKEFVIYASPPFVCTTQVELENIIKLLGGEVVSKPDYLLNKLDKIRLIIAESTGEQNSSLFDSWLESLGVVTVELEWLSKSIGKYKTQSVHQFIMCSEESIYDLGYPPELLTQSYSLSGTTD